MKHCLIIMKAPLVTWIFIFCGLLAQAQDFRLSGRTSADSGFLLVPGGCKMQIPVKVMLYGSMQQVDLVAYRPRIKPVYVPPARPVLLDIKGNVSYDFFYQSNIDTPFTERDIHQHTVQTNLTVTIRNQYPLRISFSTQQGNSSLFRNLTGAKLFYNSADFKNKILENARNWANVKLRQFSEAQKYKLQLDSLRNQVSALHGYYNSEVYTQQVIEAREFLYRWRRDSALGIINTIGVNDSAYLKLINGGQEYRRQVDSLQHLYSTVKGKYDKLNVKIGSEKVHLQNILQHHKNNKELIDALDAMNLPDSVLPKGYRTLLAIRSVGIGRTLVDYSELTAKNVSITGVQLELNPNWYLAVASGSVDYTFRNFIVKEHRSFQYLNLIRGGIGQKESDHLYLTYYMGKKELYGRNAIPLDSSAAVDNHLMGLSLEGQWKLGPQTFLTAEIAKSSLPFNVRRAHGQGKAESMFNFSGHSNEAWMVGAETVLQYTSTKVTGMYKRMGSDFQSYSFFTTGSNQSAWTLQAEQPLFRRQLMITGAIRKNSYATFYEPARFESNTIFKSLQATLRVASLPVITLAYQPTSQLVKTGEGLYTEQIFNSLSATAVYNYKYRGIAMNSMFSYSRFFNKETDSSFVYFNSRNITLSQTAFLGSLTLNGQVNTSLTREYNLYSAVGDIDWKLRNWLTAGASLQYNFQSVYDVTQLGYGGNLSFIIPYIGELSGRAEKRYIPGSGKKLVANMTGRITYTKTF